MTARNADDPRQLQIAVHELGHAWAWRDGGLTIRSIRFSGRDGGVRARTPNGYPDMLTAEAVGYLAGFEAEDRWMRAHRLGAAAACHSSHDRREFRAIVKLLKNEFEVKLTERAARAQAQKHLDQRWSTILRQAPELVSRGRLSI